MYSTSKAGPLSGAGAGSSAAIADKTKACLRTFNNILELSTLDKNAQDAANDNLSRFRIWAGNIGAYHVDSRSADYRVREAPEIQERIIELLDEVDETNVDICAIVSGERVDAALVERDGFEDGYDGGQTEMSELGLAVGDTISSLLKVAALLRKATGRDRYAKAAASVDEPFQDIFDIQHVAAKFPKLEQTPWLRDKLGRANIQRRQYLRYARKHHERLAHEPKEYAQHAQANHSARGNLQVSNIPRSQPKTMASSGQTLAQTDASTLRVDLLPPIKDSHVELLDETLSQATSLVASKVDHQKDGDLDVVRLSELSKDGEPFECPYCWTIVQAKRQRTWRKHVLRDIRAWTCTFQDCNSGLFEDRDTWFQHELDAHRRIWFCQSCPGEAIFSSSASMTAHLHDVHAADDSPEAVKAIVDASSRPVAEIPANACPLCDEWYAKLMEQAIEMEIPSGSALSVPLLDFERHLSQHLEQIALFAIPPTFERLLESESRPDITDISVKPTVDALQQWRDFTLLQQDSADVEVDVENKQKKVALVDVQYEGFMLEKAAPAQVEDKPSWSRVTRRPLSFSDRQLATIVKKARKENGAGPLATFSRLSGDQQGVITRLITARQEEERTKDAEWVLECITKYYQRHKRTRIQELVKIMVILKRRNRDTTNDALNATEISDPESLGPQRAKDEEASWASRDGDGPMPSSAGPTDILEWPVGDSWAIIDTRHAPAPSLESINENAPALSSHRSKLTATLWEDEGTLCFHVNVYGILVARREDNNMINGTKLLKVAGLDRAQCNDLLKTEEVRHVVQIGPLHLKGIWIPFDRALELAIRHEITERLSPLFAEDIGALLYHRAEASLPSDILRETAETHGSQEDPERVGDYQLQLGLLEQQNKKRLMMATEDSERVYDSHNQTQLGLACIAGDLDLAKEWVRKDPEQLELTDLDGEIPLHLAAANGHHTIVEYLIDQECALDLQNNEGETPLMLAAMNAEVKVVEMLLQAGADPAIRNHSQKQAVELVNDGFTYADETRAVLRNAALEKHLSSPISIDENEDPLLGAKYTLAIESLKRNNITEAVRLAQLVVDRRATLLASGDVYLIVSKYLLADALVADKQFDRAIMLLDDMRSDASDLETSQFREAQTLVKLGQAYHASGRTGDAIDLLHDATLTLHRLLGEKHTETLVAYHELARAYKTSGQLVKALDRLEIVTQAEQEARGVESHRYITAKYDRAQVLIAMGNVEEAIPTLEEVLATQTKVYGPAHRCVLATLDRLAKAYHAEGRADEVQAIRERMAIVQASRSQDSNPTTRQASAVTVTSGPELPAGQEQALADAEEQKKETSATGPHVENPADALHISLTTEAANLARDLGTQRLRGDSDAPAELRPGVVDEMPLRSPMSPVLEVDALDAPDENLLQTSRQENLKVALRNPPEEASLEEQMRPPLPQATSRGKTGSIHTRYALDSTRSGPPPSASAYYSYRAQTQNRVSPDGSAIYERPPPLDPSDRRSDIPRPMISARTGTFSKRQPPGQSVSSGESSAADSGQEEQEEGPKGDDTESRRTTKPRGILRKPTESFPDPVDPQSGSDVKISKFSKKNPPPGARWTKIDRRLVNPESLQEAGERFEERMDSVIVLRVLTSDEIQKFADRTRDIRDAREEAGEE